METRIDILNELKEFSPLIAGMEKLNVFTVPNGYFEGLSGHIMKALNGEETGVLNDLPKQNSFEVPAGYFDNLADTILARIRSQQNENASNELRTLSPMLYSVQNENVFEVPKGYFANLSDEILSKVQPAKVVVMRRRSSSFMRYAVAAAFTGMMALGVFKFTDTTKNNVDPSVAEGQIIARENKFDEELAKISDGDIVKYLQANGENFDAQTVASKTLDENELPSQADYMMDDKTLDKYLNNITINDLKN